jgi:sugar lactone lactonase YvrE
MRVLAPLRLVMPLRAIPAMLVVITALLSTGVADATNHVRTVVSFDLAAGEFPEGVAVDKRGNIFVSLIAPVSEIRKVRPDGTQTLLTDLPTTGIGPLGLAVDANGNVYVGLVSFDPATEGVYRVSPDGTAARLPGTGAIGFANGLAFDDRGTLYVTDSTAGAVWRVPRRGTAELWIQSPLLEGTGVFGTGFPIGANGIAYHRGSVVVANSEQATLVRIPVRPGSDAGVPSVIAADQTLFGADGLALGANGDVYVAVITSSTIVRVREGSIVTVADAADGINQASSIAFGNGQVGATTLYAANFDFFSPAPELLAIAVGVPGQLMP